MKLVAIVGNNNRRSYNRYLLQYMQQHFVSQAEIELQEIGQLPLFNEDLLKDFPTTVKTMIAKVEAADGLIIATPEYDHSMPAALKSMLEWLSASYHTLRKKPIMIVGASFGAQGTVRAQMDLRHVLDAPGVEAYVLPGNEFMLPHCQSAFNDRRQLKDPKTVAFLETCFNNFLQYIELLSNKRPAKNSLADYNWDATYDVVVLGFGGAGATAARFAADAGAKVLLVDAAPEGHEGGNTRYAGQVIGSATDFDQMKNYYQQLTYPLELDEEIIDAYVEGMTKMPAYFKQYLNVKEPYSVKAHWQETSMLHGMVPEYPEYSGSKAYDLLLVHQGTFDSAFWKNLRQQVLQRQKQIDVWFSSPAKHLLQDPVTQTILGVEIEHQHVPLKVRALNGVVLATGGFENNQQMIQDYLAAESLVPLGTLYNKGAGIHLAQEVGADLWHMHNYESLGLTLKMPTGKRGRILFAWTDLASGSAFVIGDDGNRYFNETEPNRHGHLASHGTWRIPVHNVHPFLIFDQQKFTDLQAAKLLPVDNFADLLIKADNLENLAQLLHLPTNSLVKTNQLFDHFVDQDCDDQFQRQPETMKKLTAGPYYALALQQTMLNTQGGPRRNVRSEVLNPAGQPIPHLYSAGELGGCSANLYQGGNNLAECLIFGKIAGENAARAKQPTMTANQPASESSSQLNSSATSFSLQSDITKETDFTTGKNQYLGRSNAGMGNEVIVRVTYSDQKIQNIEILKQSESGDIGLKALRELPQKMIAGNTADVDAVSGATVSSHALIQAVKQALAKATAK